MALGSKETYASRVAGITGIREIYLNASQGNARFLDASVATRMSWLAKRKTTRIGDMAYCMLGLFDINMPLLYGEGGKAFQRLQEEIIKRYNDHTIFAWTTGHDPVSCSSFGPHLGFLAPSPKAFTSAGSFTARSTGFAQLASPWSITNAGISINLPLIYTFLGYSQLVITGAFDENVNAYLGIIVGMGDMVSRATLPPSPLRICRHLFDHSPVQALYLKAFDRTRVLTDKPKPTSRLLNSSVAPLRRGHGLLPSFTSERAVTAEWSLSFYPTSVSLDAMDAFEFPAEESDWLVTVSHLSIVRTTGVVLWMGFWLRGVSRRILFTTSIVEKFGGNQPPYHIYSHFQPTVSELDPALHLPGGSEYADKHNLDFSPVNLSLVQTEHQKVVSTTSAFFTTVDFPFPPHTIGKILQVGWVGNIRLASCDMCHPSYTSLRLAVISDPFFAEEMPSWLRCTPIW